MIEVLAQDPGAPASAHPSAPGATRGAPTGGATFGRLLGAELDRYRSRGVVRWGVAAVVLLALVVGLVSFLGSRPLSAAERASADAQYQQTVAAWKLDGAQQVEDCRREQAEDPGVDLGCDLMEPRPEWFQNRTITTFADSARDGAETPALLVLALVLGLGVSFVCAEWSSGSLATWLTFVPRRGRVFASKAVAAALGGAVVAALDRQSWSASANLLAWVDGSFVYSTYPCRFDAMQGGQVCEAVEHVVSMTRGGVVLGVVSLLVVLGGALVLCRRDVASL